MNEMIIIICGLALLISIVLWLASKNVHKYVLYGMIVLGLLSVSGGFLYFYDAKLGYSVNKNLPTKFQFLYYIKISNVHYVWLVPEGSNEPRSLIIDPNKFKNFEREMAKANENSRKGFRVQGEITNNRNKLESDSELTFNIITPVTGEQK